MSQSNVAPDDHQLLRRSNELDAREAYLVTREKFAESQEQDIEAAERKLVILGITVEQKEKLIADQVKRSNDLNADYDARLKVYTVAINGFPAKIEAWQHKVKISSQNLAMIDEAITGRTAYQREQEVLIANQAESGNIMLKGLDYEITIATQDIKDLKASKRLLIQDKQQLEIDLEQARADFQIEIDEHQAKLKDIEQEITIASEDLQAIENKKVTTQIETDNLKTNQSVVNAEIDRKLLMLDTKEREIMVKREALKVEKQEMAEKRHYMSSAQSLYDVQ